MPPVDRKDLKPSIQCVAFGVGIPPHLSDNQKRIASDTVRDFGNAVFVHSGEGVSDATQGYLFVQEKGGVRCIQSTYGNAKKTVALAI